MIPLTSPAKSPIPRLPGIGSLPNAQSVAWPFAAIAVVLALQIELVFSKSINWDEFFHFSEIHQYLLGRPTPLFQVPFVYLFSWVPSLPGSDIGHILTIRALTLPFEFVTVACIFAIARRVSGKEAALVCALTYLTGGYVFLHGFALRADMIAAALLSLALWVLFCRPIRLVEVGTVSILVALAFFATIKSVLYAPAFIGVALLRLTNARQRWILACLGIGVVAAAVLLLAVGPSLPSTGPLGVLHQAARLGASSVERMFSGGLFPQSRYLAIQLLIAPALTIIVGVAAYSIWVSDRHPSERLALLLLLAPVCTAVFYRNAFPYFFSFILPPVIAAAAPGAELLIRRYGLAAVSILLAANAALLSLAEDRSVLENQRVIQNGVKQIFPRPVTYIDESGMISDFPRAVSRFASGWALANYLASNRLDYREAMERETVPLMIANSQSLQNVFAKTKGENRLLPGDEKTLRENFVPHWGLVLVAGKSIPSGQSPVQIEIWAPGKYTVEGQVLEIDGTRVAAGATIELSRGLHKVGGPREKHATLRWGDHLPRPRIEWPEGLIFTDY